MGAGDGGLRGELLRVDLERCQVENKMSAKQELKKSTFQETKKSIGLLSEFFNIQGATLNLKKSNQLYPVRMVQSRYSCGG